MTSILDRTAPRDLAADFPARLSLTPKTTLAGRLDGAWWPRSRDLEAELPPLAAALEEPWGRVTRVTVNPTRWPVIPHKVTWDGRTMHVGWFTEQDPDKLILLSYTVGRWDLLVIPPETAPAAAARLLAAAAIPGSLLTAGTLMGNETVIGRGLRDARRQEAAWEGEGGASTSPFGNPRDRSATRKDAVMATLRERKTYRDQVLQVLYGAVEGNRLLGITGAQLRRDLHVPEQDLAAACTYLAGEGLITVDWDPGNTPAMVTLTHEGIRRLEAEEEGAEEEGTA